MAIDGERILCRSSKAIVEQLVRVHPDLLCIVSGILGKLSYGDFTTSGGAYSVEDAVYDVTLSQLLKSIPLVELEILGAYKNNKMIRQAEMKNHSEKVRLRRGVNYANEYVYLVNLASDNCQDYAVWFERFLNRLAV